MVYLAGHMGPTDPGYLDTLARTTAAIKSYTSGLGDAAHAATSYLYQNLIGQAGILAYMDIFFYCALISFGFMPFTLLFSPAKASRSAGAGE